MPDPLELQLGTGLEPGTTMKYKKEWALYRRFCHRQKLHEVPGKDVSWNLKTLKKYLRWRSKTNNVRSLSGIRSKLRHCSMCFGHLLPTQIGDGHAKLRIQIDMVLKDIGKKQQKEAKRLGDSTYPKRSLALGKVAIGLLFSAYGAISESRFAKLSSATRHWLSLSVCMHSGAMRLKLARVTWKGQSLRWNQADATYRLASDWRKMKRKGAFTIPFPSKPRFLSQRYNFYKEDGTEYGAFTAADVLGWHLRARSAREASYLFAPEGSRPPNRSEFETWLRLSFKSLLIGDREEIDALIQAMTPHSFRAGLASDMEREGVPRPVIMKFGRWNSAKAMAQYARDGLGQRLSWVKHKAIKDEFSIHCLAVAQARSTKQKSSVNKLRQVKLDQIQDSSKQNQKGTQSKKRNRLSVNTGTSKRARTRETEERRSARYRELRFEMAERNSIRAETPRIKPTDHPTGHHRRDYMAI